MDRIKPRFSPGYKQAVDDLLRLDPQPGYLIRTAWLIEHFGLKEPRNIDEYRGFQFQMLQLTQQFQSELLVNHQIAIRRVRGEGYEIVPPTEQTEHAERTGMKLIYKGLKKWLTTAHNVRYEQLSSEQQRENADSMARAASFRAFARSNRILIELHGLPRRIENKKGEK